MANSEIGVINLYSFINSISIHTIHIRVGFGL